MRALVTGGARRLGRCIAITLAEAGYDLVLHHNSSPEQAKEVQVRVRSLGREADIVQADLTSPDQIVALANTVTRNQNGLDLLVNNAAAYTATSIEKCTVAEWDQMMALNLRAPFLITQALLPALRRSDCNGGSAVINITDISADRPAPGFIHYCASKAGLSMLTRSMALELAPDIRVNAIAPGTLLPPPTMSADQTETIRNTIPLRRVGRAQDIADLVLFIASAAPYVTGQSWAVDGGRSLSGPLSCDQETPGSS